MLHELKIDTNKINEDLHVLSRDIETIRKRVWDFLKKLELELPYEAAIKLLFPFQFSIIINNSANKYSLLAYFLDKL